MQAGSMIWSAIYTLLAYVQADVHTCMCITAGASYSSVSVTNNTASLHWKTTYHIMIHDPGVHINLWGWVMLLLWNVGNLTSLWFSGEHGIAYRYGPQDAVNQSLKTHTEAWNAFTLIYARCCVEGQWSSMSQNIESLRVSGGSSCAPCFCSTHGRMLEIFCTMLSSRVDSNSPRTIRHKAFVQKIYTKSLNANFE